MKNNTWSKLGLTAKELAEVTSFNCEPSMETRIESLAVRDSKFWLCYGDLIQPEFFAQEHSRLFMNLVHEFSDGSTLPDHTIARDLILRSALIPDEKRSEMLNHVDMVYAAPLVGTSYTVSIVKDMARRRAMRAAVVKIAQLNERSGGDDPTNEIESVMQAALNIGARDSHPVVSINKDFHLLHSWVDSYVTDAVPTFIPTLDGYLRGGILRGELGIILGPPHRGKTLALVNLAVGAIMCGKSVLYVSLEDQLNGVGPRIYSRLTGTPVDALQKSMPTVQQGLQTLMPLFQGELKITYRPPMTTSIGHIKSLCERLNNEDGFSPDLIIVDYADRLAPVRKRKETWQELPEIYTGLKTLGAEVNAGVWSASQTGKAGFSKTVIDLDDPAGAFGKGAEADIMAAYCQEPKERDAGQARFHIAKARNRKSGQMIHVYTNLATSTISEVPQGEIAGLVCNQKKPDKQTLQQKNFSVGSVPGPFKNRKP